MVKRYDRIQSWNLFNPFERACTCMRPECPECRCGFSVDTDYPRYTWSQDRMARASRALLPGAPLRGNRR